MRRRQPATRRLRVLVPALLGVLLTAGAAVSPAASAHDNHRPGAARVSFTKWVVTEPASPPSFAGVLMDGVVGGAVGNGQYVGTVLADDLSDPGFWHAQALYGFYGARHSFVANLQITENDTLSPATAMITGVVLAGWRQGGSVHGTYTVMNACPIPTPGNVLGTVCFQGHLTIR